MYNLYVGANAAFQTYTGSKVYTKYSNDTKHRDSYLEVLGLKKISFNVWACHIKDSWQLRHFATPQENLLQP